MDDKELKEAIEILKRAGIEESVCIELIKEVREFSNAARIYMPEAAMLIGKVCTRLNF